MTLSGQFTATGAQGTIAIDVTYQPDTQGRTTACSGSTSWTASTPPPAPRRALAGTYCTASASAAAAWPLTSRPTARSAPFVRRAG